MGASDCAALAVQRLLPFPLGATTHSVRHFHLFLSPPPRSDGPLSSLCACGASHASLPARLSRFALHAHSWRRPRLYFHPIMALLAPTPSKIRCTMTVYHGPGNTLGFNYGRSCTPHEFPGLQSRTETDPRFSQVCVICSLVINPLPFDPRCCRYLHHAKIALWRACSYVI